MTTISVFSGGGHHPLVVGTAYFIRRRGEVTTTFAYSPEYLRTGFGPIDPSLPLLAGAQYARGIPRVFADSAPDRWGRNLIDKSERARARRERRTPRGLDDVDYLLAVSDNTRQGDLRFAHEGSAVFLGPDSKVPHLLSLPRLLDAADAVETADGGWDAVKNLLDTGTTGLGGARPKASVLLDDGSLAIAKFPHSSDRWNVMAWEGLALDLLAASGVRVPDHRLIDIGDCAVLLVTRFDRAAGGERLGYMSSMTAVSAEDGDRLDYADIATAVRDESCAVSADLRQLFSRLVMSVALGNTDDHLRNHGFVRDSKGWRLSPAFDVNPTPDLARPRSTSIMGEDRFPEECEALLDFASECDLTPDEGRSIIGAAVATARTWSDVAARAGIASAEIGLMADALESRIDALDRVGRSSVPR